MPELPKRLFEVRLLVVVTIDMTDPALAEAVKTHPHQPSSVAEIVAEEVVSNLDSVSYVDAAIVSYL